MPTRPSFPFAEAEQLVADRVKAAAPVLPIVRSALFSSLDPIHILAFHWCCIRNTLGNVFRTVSLGPFDHDERGLTVEQMLEQPPAEQVWLLGYVLDPAYQGKGVMTAFLNLVLDEWVKKWMGIGVVAAVSAPSDLWHLRLLT
jgi:GNAT superfamily N-acetyltransferase